jgi:hypothetical protein
MGDLKADTIEARAGTNGAATNPPVILAGVVLLIVAGTGLVLWARLGTTVFFEMIAAGMAACF